jgi:hypothetical protein
MLRRVLLVEPHLIQQRERREEYRSHEKSGVIQRDIDDLYILRGRTIR